MFSLVIRISPFCEKKKDRYFSLSSQFLPFFTFSPFSSSLILLSLESSFSRDIKNKSWRIKSETLERKYIAGTVIAIISCDNYDGHQGAISWSTFFSKRSGKNYCFISLSTIVQRSCLLMKETPNIWFSLLAFSVAISLIFSELYQKQVVWNLLLFVALHFITVWDNDCKKLKMKHIALLAYFDSHWSFYRFQLKYLKISWPVLPSSTYILNCLPKKKKKKSQKFLDLSKFVLEI